ncbi:MAG: DUF6395 domain-containing protein [Candidatus Thermoplasmatota archaeon]|nr:DUF6395 domain-containing protein [Candidatus Thermoplasmatota archaeon]
MKFTTSIKDDMFYIKAHLIEEHGDSDIGPRFQGPFDDLKMTNDTVFYSYVPKKLHPDLLAMMCFHIFFPWVGNTIEFPEPVSKNLVKAINENCFSRFKGEIKVLNIDEDLQIYAPELANPLPSNVAISFGGGVDSTALSAIFPESPLVHEVSVEEFSDISKRGTVILMKKLNQKYSTAIFPIQTNARNISEPSGVTSWLAPIIPALMVSVDKGFTGVFLGTNLGTLFLKNGVEYRPAHEILNPAKENFSSVTVPIIQASGGISQYMATKLSAEHGVIEFVTFCESGKNATPCARCMKCLRRELMYRSINHQFPKKFPLDKFPIDTEKFLEKYNIERALKHFTPGIRQSFSHVFSTARDKMKDEFPSVLMPLATTFPPTDFMNHWPTEADELFPDSFKSAFLPRFHLKIPYMSENELIIFRNWGSKIES